MLRAVGLLARSARVACSGGPIILETSKAEAGADRSLTWHIRFDSMALNPGGSMLLCEKGSTELT